MTEFYGSGPRALPDRFDTRRLADRIRERLVRDHITADDRAFIESLDMFFLATVDAEGRPSCSYKGGNPGFVRVLDEKTLAFPSFDGNGWIRTTRSCRSVRRVEDEAPVPALPDERAFRCPMRIERGSAPDRGRTRERHICRIRLAKSGGPRPRLMLELAIAELPQAAASAGQLLESEEDVDLRVNVHDASRLEWSVSVALPERGHARYAIDVELEIPANVFARHLPWEKLQSWARLDGAADCPRPGETPSMDTLRRAAVAYAHKLARASEGFARHCRLAGAPSHARFTPEGLYDGLARWLTFAAATADEARQRLVQRAPGDSVEIARERALVDEYVSVRLMEALASAERSIGALRETNCAGLASYEPALGRVELSLADALTREVAYRDAQSWLHPHPRWPTSLERYIERASRMKKHFQEVLFLEADTYQVAEVLHNWVAGFVALVASTWAFAWQLALMNRAPTTTSRVSSGLVVIAVLAGLVYAIKDRIKEMGRSWISGNVHRFYAQRVARWRAPAKRLSGRDVVMRARESFDQCVVRRPDPLNPQSGATMPATLVRYVHRGVVSANSELLASGVRRVKHIFRYDLSPLFARLDDPIKHVPVLDETTGRVTFTAAPRCYRVPVRLLVRREGQTREERATLVLHKHGLERLDFERETEAESSPGR